MNKTALRHMMLHDDTLADEFETILGYRTSHEGLVQSGYAHHMVRFDGSTYFTKTTGIPVLAGDAQYFTCAFKVRFDAILAKTLIAGRDTGSARLVHRIYSASTDANIDFSVWSSTGGPADSTTFELAAGDELLSQTRTYHVVCDLDNDQFKVWRDGVLFHEGNALAGAEYTADLSTVDKWSLFAGSDGSAAFIGLVGFIWWTAGATSAAYIDDPTLFYNGGDVDLGSDGTADGALPAPLLFMGGEMTAAEWDGTNLGTGGNFTLTGTVVEPEAIADDATPTAFTASFTDVTNTALSMLTESNQITIAGLNVPAAITVSGGEYKKNSGLWYWTTAADVISNGEKVTLRHTTAATVQSETTTTLTIGGVTGDWKTTTGGYDFTLTANADDGHEVIDAAWSNTGRTVADFDGSGAMNSGDAIFALSFPSVTAAGTVTNATLTLAVVTQTGSGTMRLKGESNAAAASSQWGSGNLPSAATMTTAYVDLPSTVQTNNLDVTDIVNEILGGAQWNSGQRINFRVEPISTGVQVAFAAVNAGDVKPRLVITP